MYASLNMCMLPLQYLYTVNVQSLGSQYSNLKPSNVLPTSDITLYQWIKLSTSDLTTCGIYALLPKTIYGEDGTASVVL